MRSFPLRCSTLGLSLLLATFVAATADLSSDPRLQKFLTKFPDADSNQDGTLSLEEARQYKKDNPKEAKPYQDDLNPRKILTSHRYSIDDLAKVFDAKTFKDLPYRFFKPDTNGDNKYPLILSLHGAGGRGSDNLKNLKFWNGTITEPDFQSQYPSFVLVPHSPSYWRIPGSVPDLDAETIASFTRTWQEAAAEGRRAFVTKTPQGKLGLVFELLDVLLEEYPIDPDRIYVLGHSMGGFGTFEALAEHPDRFAAAIPSAGGLSPWHDPAVFKDVPVWAFHGDQDETVPIALALDVFDQIKAARGNMKLTTLGGVGHGASGFAFSYQGDHSNPEFSTALSSPACDPTENVWTWLFAQSRKDR
ncbi:MAG: alpha/beta fold hydrolase [Verrucomicrobiota bacterium]